MVDVVKVSSGSEYERADSFSRLVKVGDLIFVSHSAGVNYRTGELPEDAAAQARGVIHNVSGALASVGSSLRDVVHRRVNIPYPADVPAVMAVVSEAFRGIDPANTVACTPLADKTLKVEIELVAHLGAGDAPTERIDIDLSVGRPD